MLSISNSAVKFAEAVLLRLMIFTFCYLSYEFATMFISAGAKTHPFMAVWGDTIFEATVIIILNLQFGNSSVGRDVNALKFYILLIHLACLPFYIFKIDLSTFHNGSVAFLNVLILLRLFYFGERDLLSRISIVENSKKWLLHGRFFLNAYINGLTIAVFLLCAVPLCTLIFLINTDQMRVTGIAVILFSFFVAFDTARKRVAQAPNIVETIVQPETQVQKDALEVANYTIFELKTILKAVAVIAAISVLGLYASLGFYKASFFDVGYASGFNDAKSGTAPKRETDLNKAFKCIEVNRTKFPVPSDDGCPPVARK